MRFLPISRVARLSPLIAPILLCAVALVQLYATRTTLLTCRTPNDAPRGQSSINERAARDDCPTVKTAPLPAGSQFLNVIESVFSGMARAIIHNSDYPSLAEAKHSIDRYFKERNEHFTEFPKRAGGKIWGLERVPSEFSEGHNCKDPRY